MSLDTSLLFRPTYPKIFGKLEVLAANHFPRILNVWLHLHFLSRVGLGEVLAAEMRKRIMVMDGAMGTMIQSHHLTEEQFRGTFHPLDLHSTFWSLSFQPLHILFSSLYRWRVQGASQESQRQQWSTLPHSTSHHLWDTQGMLLLWISDEHVKCHSYK